MRIMWRFSDFHQLQLYLPSSLFSFSFFFNCFFSFFPLPFTVFLPKLPGSQQFSVAPVPMGLARVHPVGPKGL